MSRLTDLQTRLQQYSSCETAILDGAQSYGVGSRSLTRANLKEIADMIRYLEQEITAEQAKASGKRRNWSGGIIPRDF